MSATAVLTTPADAMPSLWRRLVGQRYIPFYPALAQLTQSLKAALMLGQAMAWTRHYARHAPERDGWFWQTTGEWQTLTGLSRHEQSSARTVLRRLGVLQEHARGMPRRTWFRVDLDALAVSLGRQIGQFVPRWSWAEAVVRTLLGRPVVCYRPLIAVAGSVVGGLYLSWLCASLRRESREQPGTAMAGQHAGEQVPAEDPWLALTMAETQQTLQLSRAQLERARAGLLRDGLIDEAWTGSVPARRRTRVRFDRLLEKLDRSTSVDGLDADAGSPSEPISGMAESANPGCGKPANWNGGNVHSWMLKTGQLGCDFPANMSAEKSHPLYRCTSTKPLPNHRSADFERASDREGAGVVVPKINSHDPDLIAERDLPPGLGPDEQHAANRILERLADAQLNRLVIDEWAAHLAGGALRSPLGYLAALVSRANSGQFVPARALQRRIARHNAARLDAARRRRPDGMADAGQGAEPGGASTGTGSAPSPEIQKKLDALRRSLRRGVP